ncbi:MAG: hypothetical protein GY833_12185 [Aestuariibacter sp.]|nr:hypothetical protein [Aestuariibacter sp.]|tara:strand:+ start:23728 stop:24606 length:879 start_codon:yes stop_codon:yes gene_type:complete
MALSSAQVAVVQRAMASKPIGRFVKKAPMNKIIPTSQPQQPVVTNAQLVTAMHLSKVHDVLNSEIESWHMGMSHLLMTGQASDDQAKHLHHLARASAFFDQFCVGISVNTKDQRVYLAFQRLNHAGEAMLPDEDIVTGALDDLSQSTSRFSFYAYIRHADGLRSWIDFSGTDPVPYDERIDAEYCHAALDGIDGGFVVAFKYYSMFVATAENDTELSKGVGVISDGEYKTKYHLSEPFQDVAPTELSQRVGEYRRSMQAAKNARQMSGLTRKKRTPAQRANKKAASKARKRK